MSAGTVLPPASCSAVPANAGRFACLTIVSVENVSLVSPRSVSVRRSKSGTSGPIGKTTNPLQQDDLEIAPPRRGVLCPGYRTTMNNTHLQNEPVRNAMFGSNDWFTWAILSAVFAAMTAIFAKVGLKGVDSDYATLFRTSVIILVLSVFVVVAKKWRNPFTLSFHTVTFLVLSGLATGASWVCYFRALKVGDASRVAPVDKLSLVMVAIFATMFLGERPNLREWFGIALVGVGVLILGFKK